KQLTPEQLQRIFEKWLPNIIKYSQPLEIGDLVLCVLMIGSAIGLLLMQSWGRYAAILYALLSLAWRAAWVVFVVTVFMPLLTDLMNEMVQAQGAGQGKDAQVPETVITVMKVTMGVVAALPGIYPLIVLGVMLSSKTARAFSDQPEESSTGPGD